MITHRPDPFPPWTAAFWGAYWTTLRPYLFFVSGTAGLVGITLADDPAIGPAVIVFVALFVSYGLGQALTDVYQTDTDAISSPYRPLTQGVISSNHVLLVSLLGLIVAGLGLVALNPWILLPSALGVIGLLTYTPLKRRWWGGPLWNSWIVALLPVIGFLAVEPRFDVVFRSGQLRLVMVSVLFSYAVFVLLGYFKDISADRATGYTTLPIRFGWVPAIAVSAVFTMVAVGASAMVLENSARPMAGENPGDLPTLAAWFIGVAALASAHGMMMRTRSEPETHRPIAWVVRGFILIHLAEATAMQPAILLPAAGFYLAFELALARRPERTQI